MQLRNVFLKHYFRDFNKYMIKLNKHFTFFRLHCVPSRRMKNAFTSMAFNSLNSLSTFQKKNSVFRQVIQQLYQGFSLAVHLQRCLSGLFFSVSAVWLFSKSHQSHSIKPLAHASLPSNRIKIFSQLETLAF